MDYETTLRILKEKHPVTDDEQVVCSGGMSLPILLDILAKEPSAAKYQADKIVRQISIHQPEMLYPYWDRVVALLESKNKFILWGTILTLGNLLAVDSEQKWMKIRTAYLGLLDSTELVTYSNVVKAIPQIVAAYPQEESEIIPILLAVRQHVFLHKKLVSSECAQVATEHILDCFSMLFETSSFQREMLAFAESCLDDTRTQVKTKAKRFIKDHQV